jgi:DNA-3-methyladenine glycosylase II
MRKHPSEYAKNVPRGRPTGFRNVNIHHRFVLEKGSRRDPSAVLKRKSLHRPASSNSSSKSLLTSIILRSKGPFDLPLSLQAAASFFPTVGPPAIVLRAPVLLPPGATIIDIRQSSSRRSLITASATRAIDLNRVRAIARWLISCDLDLRPFYEQVASHRIMGPVTAALTGLKPLRPATLFEMAAIAITEQQLSLAAAFHIRTRLVKRFGTPLDGLWVFPSPRKIAAARLRELTVCGLSLRKAQYLKGLARATMRGGLEFEALAPHSDQQISRTLMSNRGFGKWSTQYILARGFGRPDSLPSGDVGLRRVVGHYFASGRRLTSTELERALLPFQPFRGLAAFYLSVHWRLCRAGNEPALTHPAQSARVSSRAAALDTAMPVVHAIVAAPKRRSP